MKINFRSTEQCDFYFCCSLNDEIKIILPENILLKDFLLFLQGSLDQLKYVIIANSDISFDFATLKSTHFTVEKDFIFLNFSVRNSLKSDRVDQALQSFEDIRVSLEKILKK